MIDEKISELEGILHKLFKMKQKNLKEQFISEFHDNFKWPNIHDILVFRGEEKEDMMAKNISINNG